MIQIKNQNINRHYTYIKTRREIRKTKSGNHKTKKKNKNKNQKDTNKQSIRKKNQAKISILFEFGFEMGIMLGSIN